jgi:hypothetical protein
MANPLPLPLATGTIGEVLVQLRLLQFGVQAAPPIKDTGNDLVAFHGRSIRTLQVKTSANRISKDSRLPQHYDILALVLLRIAEGIVELDTSRIFLVPHSELRGMRRTVASLERYELIHNKVHQSAALLEHLFALNEH